MIKDLVNIDLGTDPISGLTVHIIKEYVIKTPSSESFKVNNCSIILIKSGECKIQLKDDSIEHLSTKDILVIPKNSFFSLVEVKYKLQLFLLSFTSEYFAQNSILRGKTDPFCFFITRSASKITLDDQDFLVLSLLYELIYNINAEVENSTLKKEREGISFNLFRYGLKMLYEKYQKDFIINFTGEEKLVVQFVTILAVHCKKQHSVKFYADALFVSSGYLTKRVRQAAEKTPKKLIEEAIIIEAKALLEDPELTITAIGAELEFSTASFFSNFFKKHTSISPSKYRSNTIERFKSH